MFDVLIRNGRVVDGTGLPWFAADVGIAHGKITAVGSLRNATAKQVVDAAGKIVSPGFIDTHVHGDLAVLADPYHEPSIRQGVTTQILGQDGVAFAPGGPVVQDYMRQYTAGFSGNFPLPHHSWRTIEDFLGCFDGTTAINVCTLIPNGNVRMEVMGLDPRKPTAVELEMMKRMVREGMQQGAVGLSSGLDYIPSIYADEDELAALCEEIAPYNGVYVTHMRGYNREKGPPAIQEVFNIGRRAGCPVHVSHFNGLADQMLPLVDEARKSGVDVTFDLYCYLFGSTIVSMLTLPTEFVGGGIPATVERLKKPETRKALEPAFANPRLPIETIRLASIPNESYRQYEGMLLPEAAAKAGKSMIDFTCDLLVATNLAAGAIIRHFAERQESDIVKFMKHPTMMGGSDGIYCGGRPHPRGCGCYARYVGYHVRRGDWSLEEAVMKCAGHAARRYNLKDRGFIREGLVADVVVFDPDTIEDRATFEDGKKLAIGVESVLVNGVAVLLNGVRTVALPGKGLKRL